MTTPYEDGFKCSLIGWNLPEASVPRTRMAFDDWASAFSPEQFSTLQRCDKEECEEPSLRHVMSLLRLAEYDSDVRYMPQRMIHTFLQRALPRATHGQAWSERMIALSVKHGKQIYV